MPILALLLVIVISGLSLHRAYSQTDDRDASLGIKDTLLVYPGSVTDSSWSNTEQVLSPDVREDALYQAFSSSNSAYVLLHEDEISPESNSNSVPLQQMPDAPSQTETQGETSTDDSIQSTASSTENPVPPDDAISPEQTEPDTIETQTDVETESPDSAIEQEEVAPSEPEAEPEPEPEPEQQDTPSADVPSESQPVVLKKATESVFAFLSTVTQLFPFMNTSEEATTSSNAPVVGESQPVTEPEVTPVPEPVSENSNQADASATSSELEVTETQVTQSATGTTDVLPDTATESPETQQDQTETTAAPVEPVQQRSFTLSDFSTPELKRGEFITSMQLRMSLAAQYEADASSSLPVLEINYKTPSSTQQVGTVLIDGEVSNALNGGYFLFALPQIADMSDLQNAQIEVVYKGDTEHLKGMFVDSVWLQINVEHLDKQLLQERLLRDVLKHLKNPQISTLLSEDIDFTSEELPHFSLKYVSQRNIAIRFIRDLFGKKLAEVENVSFVHNDVGDIGVEPEIDVTDDGLINIQIDEEDKERMRPGEYTVEITFNEGGVEYTDSFTFQWGLLSINPDQTSYKLGDTVAISMGALSPNGNTICDADLALYVIDPEDVLSRVPVTPSGVCNGNNVVDVPDYAAHFVPQIPGEYEMYLERVDTDGTIVAHTVDTFLVEEELPFSIHREGPSRIYPKATYPMTFTVTAQEAWEGVLVETVPASFEISETNALVTHVGDMQELSWDVSLQAGESQSFAYTFDAPDISPYLYTVGSARLEGKLPFSMLEETASSTQTQASSTVPTEVVPETPVPSVEEQIPATDVPAELVSTSTQTIVPDAPVDSLPPDTESVSDLIVTEPEPVPAPDTSETSSSTDTSVQLPQPDLQESMAATDVSAPVVFEEHRQWQIASDATGNLIVFFNSGAAIPAGWTCLSCGSGTFYQRIPMGSSTYNTTGGATTHTHTASGVVNSSATVNTENNGTGEISIPTHTHLYTPTISTVSNLPAYRQFRVIQSNNAGDPASIPAGAIMMFDDASLPSGWTRLSALDDRYPRGENSIANGGSNTHTHTITGNTTAASNLSTLNSRTGGFQVTGAADNHAHSVSGSTASQNIEPPYIEVVYATAASATTTPVGSLAMWTDTPPAQWLDRSSGPTDPFSGRFFKGATTYGTTGGASSHAPADVFGIVSGAASVTDNARSGTTGNSGAHTHLVDVTGFSTATHLPPYVTVIVGKKFGPIPMYTQVAYRLYANADSLTPTDPWPVGGDDLLENEAITEETTLVKSGDVVRLRMQLNVENSTSTSEMFKLQYATTSAECSAAGGWSDVGSATSSAAWRGYNNATPSDGTTLSSTTLSGSDVAGSYEETNPSVAMPNTVGVGQAGEWDFVVQQNNAEADAVYCFRMVESDGSQLFAYTEYPTITTNHAPDSPALSKPFDNQKVASSTPIFEFSTADSEANDITYQVQVDNDYAFTSTVIDSNSETNSSQFDNLNTPADKDPFANGETVRFNNTTALSNGTTYYWRVRAKDPTGSNTWGSWSTIYSFTVDTSVTVSTWFQTTDEQFNTNTLLGVVGTSDQAQLITGSTTGTMHSDPVDFEEGELGTAWGAFTFSDTETSSDLKYTIQYLLDDVWTDIPDSDLSGNAAGFDTSPVSLLGLDKTTYPSIRIEANFTNSGASPSVQNWAVSWDYLIETPTIIAPFANEKVATTTPVFQFETTDPQNDDLIYQIQWSTSYNFSASTTRSSNLNAGFANLDSGGDTSPFNSGDTIQFQIQAADALTNGTTYWWRVRARDPLGDNTYSFFTDPRSFTVDTSVTVSTWFQTTQSQFDHDVLSGALTQSAGSVTVATTSDESVVVYAEGTVTTPRYREWDGSAWSAESSALDVGAAINWVVTKAAPNRNEYITGTLSSDSDINLQVFKNGSWGDLNEVTTSASNVSMRGFDIAYEQSSGDAIAVYCDGDEDPSYDIWDGSTWSSGGSINFTSGVACGWIRLISDPVSDEIILVARNTTGTEYTAWVWNGSSWGNSITGGSMTEEFDEGMTSAYEDSGNQAVVALSNGGAASFIWRAWNGSSWTAAATVAIGDDFEWGSIAADDGTDNMVICYIDQDSDVGVVRWNGSAWVGQTELDTGGNSKADRALDCAFEVGGSNDGDIMVAYSDTTNLRYRSWNGAAWAAEASITTITDSATVQLRRTGANLVQLLAYDDVNDRYDYSAWNGTTWSARQAIETNGSSGAAPFKEPFMIAPRNPGVEATVIGAPLLDFDEGSGPYFDQMFWNDSEPGSSNLLYQLEYYDGDSWELVPDSLIANNSTGIGTSPLDLSGMLPVATYNSIRPVANFMCVGGNCPTLSDWTITWAAGITISGTAQAYNQLSNVTSGTVAVALNGVLQSGKTGTVSGGTWSIANVNAAPGDVITVFLTGAANTNEAVGVTVYDGVGDITGINLYERHLSIGSDDAGTVTNAELGLYDFVNTEDIFFNVNGTNDLSVCATSGCADAELYIKTGNTYQPGTGGDVNTHDLENNGTFTLNGNTIRLSGSWDNNATTSLATSTVIFTATSTSESLDETGAVSPSFYNLTFGETSGTATWSLVTDIDVNNALTVSRGTLARGTHPITVAGNLATQANGLWTGVGTTTFDGTTAAVWSDASAGVQNIGNVVVDGTTKTVSLGSNVKAQSLTIESNDTFDLSPSNYDITLYGNWTNNNTFNARSGDVFFAGTSANQVITVGGDNFYNVTFNGGGGSWAFTESLLGVNNDFALATGTVTLPTGTTTIAGSFNNSGGIFAHNNGLLYFTSSGAETITVDGGIFTNAFYDVRFQGSGSWAFTDSATTSHNFRITQGTVTLPSGSLTVVGDFLKTGGNFTHNSGEVIFITDGTHNITANGSSFNDVTFRGTAGSAWYNPSWQYRLPVTIPSGTVGSDLTDFPVYVDLSQLGSTFFNDVKADGGDIRITQSDAVTEVPFELVNIDTSGDTGELFFKGTISAGSDTEFYIYFGNTGASLYADTDPYGAQNVWTNGYEAVYHFSEDPSGSSPQYVDSTGNSNATAVNMEAGDLIAGKVGDAADVDGTNESIQTSFSQTLLRSTWSVFANVDGAQGGCDGLMFSRGANVSGINLGACGATNEIGYHWNDSATTYNWAGGPVYPTTQWFLASLVVEPTQATVYAHTGSGVTSGSNVVAHASSTIDNLDFGWDSFGVARSFNGAFDEAYLSSVARSADWLEATYLSLASSTDFFATSSIETPAVAGTRTFTDTNVTVVDDVLIDDGQVVFPSGTLTVGGSLDNNDVITANNGTVLFNSSDIGETISLGASSLYNMTFNSGTGGWTITSNATTTHNTTLTAASSFTLSSGQRLSVGGTFTNSVGGAATTWAGSTLSLEAGNYSLNAKTNTGDAYNVVRIAANTDIKMWNSSASTYTVDASGSLYSQDHNAADGDLYIYGNYPRTSGTEYWSYATDFDGTALGGSPRQVDVRFASGASASFSGSTLSVVGAANATTTIANQGSGTYTLAVSSGTTTAQYYSFADLGATGVSLANANHVTTLSDGSFTASVNTGTALTISSTTIDANPALQIQRVAFATTTAINAYNVSQTDGTPTSYWWFRNSSGNLDGEAHDNDTGDPGSIRWDDSSLVFTVTGTVFADNGVTPLIGGTCNGVATPVRVVVENGSTYDGTCSAVDGSYSISGVTAIGDPTITVFLNGASGGERAVTVTKTPTQDITDLDLYTNRTITRHEDAAAMSIEDMAAYDATDDSDILFTAATGTVPSLVTAANSELFVWATTTFTPGGTVTLVSGGTGTVYDGSLYIANGGAFTGAGTTTYNIGGSFTLDAGASFAAASSTVLMTATTSGKTLNIANGETATFNLLRFTGVGGGWNLNGDIAALDDIEIATGTVTGTGDISLPYGSIFGAGLLSLGGGTTTLERTNTLGGSQGWTFFNLALGNGIVTGSTTPASTATTTIGGRLTIATGHYLDAGSSSFDFSGTGTVFVENGTFLEDTSTVRYSGGGATAVIPTAYYNLDLNAGAGSPTYTATGIGIGVLHNLSVGGDSTTSVDFNANDTVLDVNGDVLIHANGTFIGSNAGSFTVAGNWDNDGTYTSSNGTVTFDGGGSSAIAAGASSFGNVTINGAGTFTISEDATTTGAFNLSAAAGFTLTSGETLAVGGSFTNGIGGAATTWTGSTLRLYSATNYQINAKTISDAYNILSVSANTDIRMWNSSASTYVVDASGSLYSQDHAGVDGDLYVYGNYPGNGSNDFWSYATDFDGVALATSSRQVDVRFASGASMSLTSGGLQVMGTASASTSLQNQGSGMYGLLIGGTASTSWRYYDVEDTNSSGLTFSGTPNVVTLSRGDFEVSQAGGSAITVGGTVINANPAKTFTNNAFATTTGISAFNVTATGTSVSSWRFTNHTGNLDGEAYDVDPDGDPGYIVWDDSAASIAISGNVYSDEGSTVSSLCDGTTSNIHVRVAGLTSYTTSCNASTGAYSVSGVTYSPGDSIVAYIDGETQKGAVVTEDPVSNINNLHIYENRVIVRHEGTDPLSIADMAVWDSSDDADIPFTAVDAGTDTLTLPANRKLIVWSGKEFEPNGNVTLSGGGGGAAYDGTFEAFTNAIVTFTGTQQHSIGGSFILDSGATLDAGQSTTTFTTSGAARTIDVNDGSFYNVAFTGSGSWTITDATFDVQSAFITSGALTLPTGTTTVSGSWSNNGGSFTINGSTMVFDATSGGNVLRGGGSNFEELIFNGAGGSWSMTDINATSTGSVTIAAGTVSLPSGVFAVGGNFRNTGGTITHNTSDLILTNATAASLKARGSDLYAIAFNGAGTFTMEDSGLSLLDDLRILQGSVTLATGTLSIGGSFTATGGTFDNATGTILFNSSDAGETINPGTSDFYNVVFNNAGGGWTIAANATTTNNFTLTAASAFTQQSGTRLYVGNVFTNSVGGAATTWNGTTLVLDSGNAYSMNSKTAGGDQYQTLVVGADTDIRAWNSRATTTTVSTSGSLYSQDHAGTNGALSIFGDFHISTTTEYWNYATDFDGTALTGSERAVTVSIAANATTTVDGGSLNIVGVSGNQTTIQNQGSGTYAFSVSDGSFNGLYYRFRNLNASGLSFSGTPTITSLSQGDFELAVNGGTLISLSSATLDANASMVITGNRFATTTAITGTNVALTGTTSNAWTFVSHTGNLDGEDYDDDGATACGSIRWSDSSCLLTQQTHYRWRNDDGGIDVPNTEWFDASWDARKRVRLQNPDSTTYTNAVVKLDVAYDADMQSDFDDLRFTDQGGTTTIPHFIERYTASTDATVWVQVPSLAAEDISTIFMYFDNASASSTSSSTATFAAADDFEDGNISEYSGDTSLFTVDGTFAYGGSYGLDATGHESDKATDGIARTGLTVSQGQIIRYMQYIDTSAGSGDEVCTLFGVQSPVTANQNYAVCLEQFGVDRVSLVEDADNTDTSGTVLASSTISYSTGWYEVEIDWQTNDDIDVTVSKDGSVAATVSANDPTYTSGGIGFSFWFQNGGWDNYTARPRVDTEPTVYFGDKQTDGGASWAADLDTSASYTTNDIARLRLAMENSGLQITGQTFDLEYAVKGAAPSCEAVPNVSYVTVPVQSSCGSSPLCMQSSSFIADNSDTTDLLFGTEGQFTSGKVVEDPSNTTASLTIGQDEYTELEYAVTPTVNASDPSYCLRVTDAGDPVDTYLSVAELELRFDPVVTNVSLNGGNPITLNPGATTTVYATGTVSDLNGYTDLALATSTMYRSGVAGGAACTSDNNNCYISSSPLCSFNSCSGNSCTVSCSADIYFHADATDVSPYEGENWLASIEVADQAGSIDIGTVPAGVELFSLHALEVTQAINYGSLSPASTTGSYNPTTTVQNLGNVPIDIELEGTDLSDGASSVIPTSEQIFATSTFTYTSCVTCDTLSSTTPVALEVDLSKPTSSSSPVTDVVYWGIEIPIGIASNPHSGTNIFYAVSD